MPPNLKTKVHVFSVINGFITTIKAGHPFEDIYFSKALIKELVRQVVFGRMNKKEATIFIQKRSQDLVPEEARSRLVESVEQDLINLHEGNIARHKIRPSDYGRWNLVWK